MVAEQSSTSSGTITGWGSIHVRFYSLHNFLQDFDDVIVLQEGGLISTALRKDTAIPIPGDCRPYQNEYDRNLMICAGDGNFLEK